MSITQLNCETLYFNCIISWLCIFSMFRYCGSNTPDDITLKGPAAKKGLKVTFMSDKKKVGRGAQCVAQCIDGSATTTTTSTTTTSNTPSGIVQKEG